MPSKPPPRDRTHQLIFSHFAEYQNVFITQPIPLIRTNRRIVVTYRVYKEKIAPQSY